MDVPSVLISLALLIIVAVFVIRPVLVDTGSGTARSSRQREVDLLLSQRAAALEALADLDFDRATGKIDTEDYAAERILLVEEGVEILKKLDAVGIDIAWTQDKPPTRIP